MAKTNNIKNRFPPFDSKPPNTITSVTLCSKPFDIQKAFEKLNVLTDVTLSGDNGLPRTKEPKFPLVEETGIISLRIKEKVRRTDQKLDDNNDLPDGWVRRFNNNNSWLCRGMVGNIPFSTSLAIDYSGGNKNFSVKVFNGTDRETQVTAGKFQICGSRSYDEATSLVLIIFDELKEIGASPEDNEISWIDPVTINYDFSFDKEINREKLAEIFSDYEFNFGYDNLALKRIVLTFETKASKKHLKSAKKANQKVQISKNGKITMHGPDIDELEDTYNLLTNIFNKHYNEIVYNETPNPEARRKVLSLFAQKQDGIVTIKDLKKLELGKPELDKIIDELLKENKIVKVVGTSRSIKYSLPVEKKEEIKKPVEESAILSILKQNKGKSATQIAKELFDSDNWEYITNINAILYRKIRENIVRKERVDDILVFYMV